MGLTFVKMFASPAVDAPLCDSLPVPVPASVFSAGTSCSSRSFWTGYWYCPLMEGAEEKLLAGGFFGAALQSAAGGRRCLVSAAPCWCQACVVQVCINFQILVFAVITVLHQRSELQGVLAEQDSARRSDRFNHRLTLLNFRRCSWTRVS